MRYLRHLVKSYPFSIALFLLIWYLSFFTPPKTRLDDVELIDKWVHITMYGGSCSVLWAEYGRRHAYIYNKVKLFLMAWLAPIAMSGAIELLQEYCTGGRRSGDWLDLAANAIGVSLAVVIGLLWGHWRAKRRKASL